jgi:CDP-6-deoxy-D-xylo-4-hexulose-3-dehydrase
MTPPTKDWQAAIDAEWAARRAADAPNKALFPLAVNPFGADEIRAMVDVLLSGRLTLGERIAAAEREFAAAVGAPFAVMVNSGSSANLLAIAAIVNKLRAVHLDARDEVLVPAVCWSTSAFPLIQLGLTPVFVDVDPVTLNADMATLESYVTSRTKAMMAVHVLGNSVDMQRLLDFVDRHNLILVEDTCESLGSTYVDADGGPRFLGTAGDFGTYSFYFSHHITSGEGGMVVCKTQDDYNYLRCLRAHGWTRHLTNSADVEAAHPTIDPRFLFVNVGYNLRPLEVQGAMLSVQLTKLHAFNECRRENMARIQAALTSDARFAGVMALARAAPGTDPAWFGIAAMLQRPYAHQLQAFLAYLSEHGIENRPIISGNFVRQPAIAAYCPHARPEDFPGAEAIHTRGFFIGVHQVRIEEAVIAKLVDVMLAFEFKPRKMVLVTGSGGMLGRHVQDVVARDPAMRADADWAFVTRRNGDLTRYDEVTHIFKKYQPTHVLHCAARLQALRVMTDKPVDFWMDNVNANNNVLRAAHESQGWAGPIKVVSVLSTVMFPRDATYPMTAEADRLYSGRFHPAAESYAAAKRALAQLTQWYRTQYGDAFTCVLPGNFYGAYGDFDPASAPLVNAMIARAVGAVAAGSTSPLQVMGTGDPERQIMHAADLARACTWALFHYDDGEPLIVAGEEVFVRHLADLVCQATGFTDGLVFDGEAVDGPLRRTADTSKFAAMCPGFAFQPLLQGIKDTVAWYENTRVCGGDGGGGGATAHVQMAQPSPKAAAEGAVRGDAITVITAA